MITPLRGGNGSAQIVGDASGGRRIVRSVLEHLATNVTPQPMRRNSDDYSPHHQREHDEEERGTSYERGGSVSDPRHQDKHSIGSSGSSSSGDAAAKRKGFSEVSTRTNRSRFMADGEVVVEGSSALAYLSPPKPNQQPPPQRRAASVPPPSLPHQQKQQKESSPQPHPNSNTGLARPTPLRIQPQTQVLSKKKESSQSSASPQSSSAQFANDDEMYSKDEVDELLKATLYAYVAQRDEEEERVLSQATSEIDALQQMLKTLEEENKILIEQLDASAKAKGATEATLTALRESSNAEASGYKKAIGLLKRQCTDLTAATTEFHNANAEVKREAEELRLNLERTVQEAARAGALHREEVEAMRRGSNESSATYAAEVRSLEFQRDEARSLHQEAITTLERSRGEASAAREAAAAAKAEAEELRRQLSAQKSRVINVGHQRSAVESAKKEEVRDLSERLKQLEDACRSQTEDIRKKLHKITSLEAQRDDMRKQLDDCHAEMQRFGDKMGLVSHTVQQIVSAAEQMDSILDKYSNGNSSPLAQQSSSSSSSAPNATKRRLRVPLMNTAKRSASSSAVGAGSSSSSSFFQRVLAAVSDVVQHLQPVQYVIRDAAAEVALVLDERAVREIKAEDATAQLVTLKAELSQSRRQIEASRKAAVEAKDRCVEFEKEREKLSEEIKNRQHALSECQHRLALVTNERDEAAAELQSIRKARTEEKALVSSEVEAARSARGDADKNAEDAKNRMKEVEDKLLDYAVVKSKAEVLEKELSALTAQHEKLNRQHKKALEDKKVVEEAAALSTRELNILHNKVRTLESSNAGLRKKVATLSETVNSVASSLLPNTARSSSPQVVDEAHPNTNNYNPHRSSSSSKAIDKKGGGGTLAAQLQREIEGLRRDLENAQEDRRKDMAEAEGAMSRVLVAISSSCEAETSFLESIVGAVARFVSESVSPYQQAVEKCARESGGQQVSPPPPDFFSSPRRRGKSHVTNNKGSKDQEEGDISESNDTTIEIVALSPPCKASGEEFGGGSGSSSAATRRYGYGEEGEDATLVGTALFTSPAPTATKTRALKTRTSSPPLSAPRNSRVVSAFSFADHSSPSPSSPLHRGGTNLMQGSTAQRTATKTKLQRLMQQAAAALTMAHPQIIREALSGLKASLQSAESELVSLRRAASAAEGVNFVGHHKMAPNVPTLIIDDPSYSSSSYYRHHHAVPYPTGRTQTLVYASSPSDGFTNDERSQSPAARVDVAARTFSVPPPNLSADQQAHSYVYPPPQSHEHHLKFTSSSPSPMNPSSSHASHRNNQWAHATTMLKDQKQLSLPVGTNMRPSTSGQRWDASCSAKEGPSSRVPMPTACAASVTRSLSPQSSAGGLSLSHHDNGRDPSPSRGQHTARTGDALSSSTAVDGSRSPRRPPVLRSASSGGAAALRRSGVRADSGPALQLPSSSNIILR